MYPIRKLSCNVCREEIVGFRFHCKVCKPEGEPYYNHCRACESKACHPEHLMVRTTLAFPGEGETFAGCPLDENAQGQQWLKTKDGSAPVSCKECEGEIRGFVYECDLCPEYFLCGSCQNKGKHSEHSMLRSG